MLFSGEMVRAILEGRKTQTRRPIKPQPKVSPELESWVCSAWNCGEVDVPCPFGEPGDLLWVRETWRYVGETTNLLVKRAIYQADCREGEFKIWRSPATMPRWAARIWLRVTDVRVERVQSISEEDAREEGVGGIAASASGWDEQAKAFFSPDEYESFDAVRRFRLLWNVTYGPESWDRNDWVWRIAFERCEAPARDVKCPQCYGHGETAWDDTRMVRCGACAGTGKAREGGR